MSRTSLAFAFVIASLALSGSGMHAAVETAPTPALSEPAVSPDGREIAFIADGDIWSVPAAGGDARLLVSGPATESQPLYSPDGRSLAFVSTRTGNGDIYILDFASGDLRRVTYDDGADELTAWSHDNQWLYFNSGRDNIGDMPGVYRVRASGGTPMPVALEAYRTEVGGAPSPDGRDLALVGGGMASFQWWRHGRSHIDEGSVWLMKNDGSHQYSRLTPDGARAQWPMWAADGQSLYYVTDRSGAENIWRVTRGGDLTQITKFENGRVLWPTIAGDGRVIAFERQFGIWTLDPSTGASHAVQVHLRGTAEGQASRHESLTRDFSELALSPDGRKIAFIVHGEVFAADSDKGGRAARVTQTPDMEYGLTWAPDSRRVVYVSERQAGEHLFLYDFVSGKETALTDGPGEDTQPAFSPDGKTLAFLRDTKKIELMNVDTRQVRDLVTADIDLHPPLTAERPFAWSPDGRWIAYLASGSRLYANAYVVSVADGKGGPVSFLANTNGDDISWTPDGKALLFATGQRTEPGEVARVDLVPRTPTFIEDRFHDLFKEPEPDKAPERTEPSTTPAPTEPKSAAENKPATESVRVVFDGVRERLQLIPIGLDVSAFTISPDGKTLLVTAGVAGRSNLYRYSIDPLADEPAVAQQLTHTAGSKSDVRLSGDGKKAFYLDGGRIFSIALSGDSPDAKALGVTAEIDVDAAREHQAMFEEAWHWLRDNFHAPDMNGVDWNAVRAEYAPYIAAAHSSGAVRRLLNLLVGELNSSHSGVGGGGRPAIVTGRLGLRFDPAGYEQHGRFQITEVVPLSPAAIAGITPGEYLTAIDGVALDGSTNLAQRLEHTIGREVHLTIRERSGSATRDVKVKPVNGNAEESLVYDAWVETNRRMVDRLSGGRLGYVHMPDMSMQSLERLYLTLDAQNSTRAGVVIDIRNNFGGFVNAYALDVLARRPYLNMTFRGMSTAVAARSVLGQRSLERPTVLVTNRVTLSDGEDFTEGYRALGLGKVVGEPTAGWIIYTSNAELIDGSSVRLPFITITDVDGKPMELHPRPVDVPVTRPLGESYQGKDSDLAAAVQTLLSQVEKSSQQR
jgi:Tol biopolymer transport system component/C-terminal processing protease CtpA/Prc